MSIGSVITKIWRRRWFLRAILPSIYFNFHFLPFKQAVRLPILVYKPHFHQLNGKIAINGPLKFGMIKLGINFVSIYPNSGIQLEINGDLTFNGNCTVGNNSAIAVGPNGRLNIGEHVIATADVKIVCYDNVSIHDNALIGWGCVLSDSDFHEMETPHGTSEITSPIEIGSNNWFAMQCLILKGARTADNSVFAARSLVNKDYSHESPCTLYAGTPAKARKVGYSRKR